MEPKNSFVFYRSFYDAALLLHKMERVQLILAICEYALDGKEPDLTGAALAVFLIAKPNLDENRRRFEIRKRGGKSKTQNKHQAGTDVDVNVDENVNVNDDVNGNEEKDVN